MRHILTEDIVWGDRFGTVFMFRNFGRRTQNPSVVKGAGGNKLKVLTLPASDRPSDVEALSEAAVRARFPRVRQEFATAAAGCAA